MKAITLKVEDHEHRWLRQAALDRGVTVKALLLGGVDMPPSGVEPKAEEANGEGKAKVVIRPGSLLARMGKMDEVPPKVSEDDLADHPAFVLCEDPACRMKIRHGAH